MIPVITIAKYFLCLSEPDTGDSISNLKLQKLLYYAQGFHLVIFNKPLFDAKIVAWGHGPVVEEMYHVYKEFGSNGIPIPTDLKLEDIPAETRELLDEVHQIYGQFSAWKLRNMTHNESPWNTTAQNSEITHDKLIEYFKTQIN